MTEQRAVLPVHLIILCMSISFYILMPVLGQQLINVHGLNMMQVTWLLSLRIIVQDLCMVVGGHFCNRFGSRRSMAIAAFVRGTGFLLYSISPNFLLLCLANILSGLGGSFFFPSVLDYYNRHSRKEDMSGVISIKGMMDAVGSIIGPLLGIVFVACSFFMASLASSVVFYLCGIVALLFLQKDEPPTKSKFPQNKSSLKTIFCEKTFLKSAVIIVIMMFFANNLTIAITAKINEIDPLYPYIGYISVTGSILLVLFQVKLYNFVSSTLSIKTIIVLAAALFTSGYLIMGLSTDIWSVYLAVAIISFGTLLYAPTRELLLVQQNDGQDVALYYGVLGLLQSVANLLLTPVIGWLFELSSMGKCRIAVWLFFVLLGMIVVVSELKSQKTVSAL